MDCPRRHPGTRSYSRLRSPTFRLTDLLKIDARAAAPLAAVSLPAIFDRLDHIDADTFLKSINFPEAARHLAFEVFSRSFFASPTDLSAAELATMFHIYFLGSSEGLVFDVVNANFDTALWNPLKQYLTELGVRFHQGVSVSSIQRQRESDISRRTPMPRISWTPMPSLWPPTLPDCNGSSRHHRGCATTCGGHGSSGSAPPRRSWCTGCGSTARSTAGRAAFLGTSGHEPVDNISVLDRYERQATDWARRTGGSVVELHSYAVESPQSNDAMLSQLHKLYPETRAARIVHERMLQHHDCPLFAPGTYAHRPSVVTPQPGLLLAGDGVRIDLPVALMERAATTGWTAANEILQRWGLAGHELSTVPTQGRSALLRHLAGRERLSQR